MKSGVAQTQIPVWDLMRVRNNNNNIIINFLRKVMEVRNNNNNNNNNNFLRKVMIAKKAFAGCVGARGRRQTR